MEVLFVKLKREVTMKNKDEDQKLLRRIIYQLVNKKQYETINSALID